MNSEKLAIEGGNKAAGKLGPFPTKIGKDELIEVLNDKNPDLKPRDDFKDKYPNYRKFSADPLAPLNAADIVKPKKT